MYRPTGGGGNSSFRTYTRALDGLESVDCYSWTWMATASRYAISTPWTNGARDLSLIIYNCIGPWKSETACVFRAIPTVWREFYCMGTREPRNLFSWDNFRSFTSPQPLGVLSA